MAKRLWFIIGLVTGLLVGELLRRKQLQRLAILETQETHRQANYAKYEKEREDYIASLSTEDRITWAMWEAEDMWDEMDVSEEDDFET